MQLDQVQLQTSLCKFASATSQDAEGHGTDVSEERPVMEQVAKLAVLKDNVDIHRAGDQLAIDQPGRTCNATDADLNATMQWGAAFWFLAAIEVTKQKGDLLQMVAQRHS